MFNKECALLLEDYGIKDRRNKIHICARTSPYGYFKEKGCDGCPFAQKELDQSTVLHYYNLAKKYETVKDDYNHQLYLKDQKYRDLEHSNGKLQKEIEEQKSDTRKLKEELQRSEKRFSSVMKLLEAASETGVIDLDLLIKTVNTVDSSLYFEEKKRSAGNSESKLEEFNMGIVTNASEKSEKYNELYDLLLRRYEGRLNPRIDFEEFSYGINSYVFNKEKEKANSSAEDEMSNLAKGE